jgi:prepilin-type N-terminal cleavage/methylation domain-containing protein
MIRATYSDAQPAGRSGPRTSKGNHRVLNQPRSDQDHKNIVEQGFTLVELLIVIVIMGILAGIVVFAVSNLSDTATKNACKTEADTVRTAAEAYKAQNLVYPTMVQMTPPTANALLKSTPKAFDADADIVFTAAQNADTVAQFEYDSATGSVTQDPQCT